VARAVAAAVSVGLSGVVIFDGTEQFAQCGDELGGGFVGQARQEQRLEDGGAFHWTSSRAV